VRAMHEDCLVVETELSYVRRLAQARIDIVRAEMDRRATGGSVSDLVAKLPEILSDPGPRSAPVASRLPRHLAPDLDETLHGDLDEVVEDGTLASLPTLSDAELEARLEELREVERDVSNRRRAMFDVIDRIEADLTERHKVGRA
jgi:anti-sigma-K factor RsiG